jgi:DNA polymerase-1
MTFFPNLADCPIIGIDTECTGLRFWRDKLYGISIALPDGQDLYYDIRRTPRALEWARDELPRAKKWVAYNAKYDLHMLREAGVNMNLAGIECAMVQAALLDEHRFSYELDAVAKDVLGIGKDETIWQELADMFGGTPTKNAQIENLQRAPASLAGRYAKVDARRALQLWEKQILEIHAQGLTHVYEVERDLLPVLTDMERGGVRVDLDRAERAVTDIDKLMVGMQRELDSIAGFKVNSNPSGSIHKLFEPKQDEHGEWTAVDGTPLEATDAGKASINSDALRKMKHPAAALILRLRQYAKTRDTFLKGHILGNHHHGIVHANFNQTKSDNDAGTGTGRLSVNGPALQQIHKRNKEIAAIVRACFMPDDGQDWCCHDWAQMDFRVFAYYVNDPTINTMYANDPNSDFHQLVADMTGLPRSPTPTVKGNAKQINLGLVFGMGPGKLAREMGLPFTKEQGRNGKVYLKPGAEATVIFDKYHTAVPGVKRILSEAESLAKSRGYVKTILGRRLRFPGGRDAYKAGGLVFQGSAADSLKVKIPAVWRFLRGTGGRFLLNVHDEFDTSLPRGDEGVRLAKGISEIIECFDGVNCPIKFRIPIRSDAGVGPNWYEASK